MPGELDQRGVKDTADACAAVMRAIESDPIAATDSASSGPDDVFRRLARG
jgi:hypothetical protein